MDTFEVTVTVVSRLLVIQERLCGVLQEGSTPLPAILDLLTFDFPISCAPVPSLTTLLSPLHPRHSFVTLVLNEEQMASQGNAAGQQQAVGQKQQQPVVNGTEACVWFEASKIYRRRAADPNDAEWVRRDQVARQDQKTLRQ
ncbi:hypothetical protein PC119_g6293 [Phytophthora cactorum]|uniref:Uncharacterized protein n=1 Tax=Phytophthora cactorum TaxID=29920 RepID=A0A8T1D1L0_9STRA|nr:hypothetical protein PC114_g6826 [Phytophthora cactorum]KAG2932514.1 hypothetical protein PC115_g5772 [Phytophthora cactorum]KAG3030281.1 hypothetical protein PC119_g6293 [Phytophthora cactorum]